MQKNLTQLEHKVADKLYHFVCDQDSSIEHAKEALFQFIKHLGKIEDAYKAAQIPEIPKEEPAATEVS